MSNDSACGTQHEGVVSLVPAGCGARVCREQAEETPPIPLISRSAKCGNGREVPADHEAPGQEMHQKLQESEVADVRRATAERGLARSAMWPRRLCRVTVYERNALEALGNKASHNVSGARWVAASVPRTGQCRQEWTRKKNSQGRDPRTHE